MKKILLTIVISGLMAIFAVAAFGQETPGADTRQKNQKHRIKQGGKSSEITRREAKSVKHSYKSAKRYEAKAKSDGVVTKRERTRLKHKENRSSRNIYRVKHNNRNRN
jgi:Tfp pilus assembly protein FimT